MTAAEPGDYGRVMASTRSRRYGLVVPVGKYVVNPLAKRLAPHLRGLVVLETIGRTSGQPRRTPIGGRRTGRTFWLVSEFGRQSNYVRNLEANPRVRLQIDGEWLSGTATIVDDDDPRARMRSLGRLNSLLVKQLGNELLSIRIDLDDAA
jgi:deazaflavin-dependent oxidoreductase (nitroreductase family)